MAKHEVLVDLEKCIGCGICEKDCVAGAISINDGKMSVSERGCISCGHCEAICPNNAVILTGFKDEPISYTEQTRLNPDELMMAIRTRRTIRQFKDEKVPKNIIKQIIEAGRIAPTGANAQNTGFIVLNAKQEEIEAEAVSMFRKVTGPAKNIVAFLKEMELPDDFFFKKAPLVIVVTGNAVNASLAAENMAFMAEAYGLGVLYSGFFTMCANNSLKIRKLMRMGKNEKAVTTLVIGYPAVKYYRTARREAAKLRILK